MMIRLPAGIVFTASLLDPGRDPRLEGHCSQGHEVGRRMAETEEERSVGTNELGLARPPELARENRRFDELIPFVGQHPVG